MRMLYALFVFMALTFAGCGPGALELQTRAANQVALAANAVAPVLITSEQVEGDRAIDAAADKAAARAQLAAVEAKWAPIWTAYKALAVAQDQWATALEKGGDTAAAVEALRASFCKLKVLLPLEVKLPPAVSAVVCLEVGHAGK